MKVMLSSVGAFSSGVLQRSCWYDRPQPKIVEGKLPSKGFPYPKALFKGGINTKANGFRRSMFSLLHDVANSS